jgi:SAM-dependent methyltransferase
MQPIVQTLRSGWRQVPVPLRDWLRRTGMIYAANYYATYREMHQGRRFAGNLSPRPERPAAGRSAGARAVRAASFDEILESIVLPNGVRKTTAAGRQVNTLKQFLRRPERPPEGASLRVLDLPSSSGAASVDSYDLLSGHYSIAAYVLADLCLEVKYDRSRNAIYDSAGRLLQVQGSESFFSIYRAHTSDPRHTLLSQLLLWPVALRARYLKRQYALAPDRVSETIRLLHPEAERRAARGMFAVQNADVFSLPWVEAFDLVLSFNLLQENYFPPAQIAKGLRNLGRALAEGGYLITGNTESFGVMRKTNGKLVMQYRQGEW